MKNLLIMLMLALPIATLAANEDKQKNTSQEATAVTTLEGTIGDVSNYAPLSNVTLTLTSHDADVKKVVKTNEEGKFVVKSLPAGIYKVKFEKKGYETGNYQSLTIREGTRNSFGFLLFED
ncbi:MAG TPA: carboxypeptidase-like regulatory domain-containing protein [Flavipsychrobacter sp.]|nr:carboxypeptidase-like regulatory domain-containing protein [Flavipsychrobacter sp.]